MYVKLITTLFQLPISERGVILTKTFLEVLLIMKGYICKIADDLYVGGQTDEELFNNWVEVLKAFAAADIRLTGPKTIIAPTKTQLLG
jgi:hypothetical protein